MDQLSIVEGFIFDTALPSLKSGREFDRRTTNIILYASTMATDIPQDEVNRLYLKLKYEIEKIKELSNKESQSKLDILNTTEVGNAISDVDADIDMLFQIISQKSHISDEKKLIVDFLKKMQIDFSLTSEINYLNMWDQLVSLVRTPNTNQAQLIESIANIAVFVEVEAQIYELFVLVERLSDTHSKEDVLDLERRTEFLLQKSAQSILSRQESASLATLSELLEDIRKIANGPSGLVPSALNLIELQARRLELSSSILHKITNVSELQRKTIADTEDAMNSIGALLKTAVSHTIVICLFGLVFILAPTLTASSLILKRQIADRMATLSETVEKIAAGEIETKVDTRGYDEISTIAHALENFKRSARELLRSNSDLERFAYVASHDLRSPIQAIHNLASWTLEDANDSLPKDAKENLELILVRTERMRQLTSDLLLYAKLHATDSNVASFNCQALVEETIELVCSDERFSFDMDIRTETVIAPVAPLRMILGNLIGNAIKHHDQPTGHISIYFDVTENLLTISVEDDGPGIPTAFHDEIFEPFKRLQSQDEVAGSGMGLAIITRLVQTFEGSIEVHSDPAARRGTTFIVKIPLSDQDLNADELRKTA